jgi:hypothetical protein
VNPFADYRALAWRSSTLLPTETNVKRKVIAQVMGYRRLSWSLVSINGTGDPRS